MINLLFAGNYKVFDGLLISLLSITKHTTSPLSVYVLSMDLTELNESCKPISMEQIEYLQNMLKETNKESTITLINTKELFTQKLGQSKNLKTHFTPYTMLRLLIDDIDGLPDKLLYLDTDTICNNNIEELFNIDISNYELACVKDVYNWASPSRWLTKNYFNAGVLLINLNKCKETKLFEKARYLVNHKKMLYVDQDALNKSVKYKLMLPVKFNSKDKYYKEIVIHHFCNVRQNGNFFKRIKPWDVELVKTKMNAYDNLLDEYVKRKNNLKVS
ncbi:MAG: hypothetical protein IJT25_03435 [Clostridia bacterium]|nr:hypothetical protein [Clostridia bacterium]